ncbi:MarR family winged helix-turn-helix transcriptional regulator [Microbacterium sp.]|uniref:MarR family winged helix-turn-helix transcriptional regulator n=1 Tax=Microbacterium sp. TaxID=51671 RepID=UPI003F72B4E0
MGEEALPNLGVAGREYCVLALLDGGSRPSQRQIGAVLCVNRTTTTATLNELEGRGSSSGYATRRIGAPTRKTLIQTGERLRQSLSLALMECEERHLEGLDATERQALRSILERLTSPR